MPQGELMRVLKAIAWLAVAVSIAWAIFDFGFEPAAALVASITTLCGIYYSERKNTPREGISQTQTVSGRSVAVQAGRDARLQQRDESDE